jgi:rubredoxin
MKPSFLTTQEKIESKQKRLNMGKYVCSVCGYIYDPQQGDPEGGIAPGTGFEDLPGDWKCPGCGALKQQFKKMRIR